MITYAQPFHQQFQPAAAANSPANALLLALASKLAYENHITVASIAKCWDFDDGKFLFIDKNETQGFIAVSATVCLVAFRGTTDLADWLVNINARIADDIHTGFRSAYGAVEADVAAHLAGALDNNQPVWITGHSLGGALARIAALHLAQRLNLPIQGVYTFGQPKVGDANFIKKYSARLGDRTHRYVHNNDVVPKVPLFLPVPKIPSLPFLPRLPTVSHPGFAYEHESACMFIPQNGKAAPKQQDPAVPLSLQEAERILQVIRSAKTNAISGHRPPEIADHDMDRYIEGCA